MLTFLTLQLNFNLLRAVIIRLVYAIIILWYLVIAGDVMGKGMESANNDAILGFYN